MPTFEFEAAPADAGKRLDKFLRDVDEPSESRSQVKKRIDRGEVFVNDAEAPKAGVRLEAGDRIRWEYQPPTKPDLTPQDLPVDILYQDGALAVINKPAGMVVHPGPGHPDGTLVNALLYHLDNLAGVGDELRPGIVHRLDKETSGVMVATKTDEAHWHLAEAFKEHTIERAYHALIFGAGLPDEGTFDTGHRRDPNNRMRYTGERGGDRRAITHYEVRERFDSGAALVECRLETGRTHQIRMHFYEANAPVLGDSMYAGRATSNTKLIDRQALHARLLGFEHPDGRQMRFEAAYPADFRAALEHLRGGGEWRA